MKRKFLCAVLSLLMVVTMLPIVVGATDPPKITFEQQTTAAGASEVKVDVKITYNPGFVSATIPVKWDASVMTLKEVTGYHEGVAKSGWCGMSDYTAYDGLYYLAWNNDITIESKDDSFKTDGTLCTMVFTVKDTTKDTSTNITADLTAEAIIANMMNFDMADLRDSGLTATTAKVNMKAASSGETILGDVNGDASINNKDLMLMLDAVSDVSTDTKDSVYDLNDDGEVNNKDLMLMLDLVSANM